MSGKTLKPWWQSALERVGVRVGRVDDLRPSFDARLAAVGAYVFVHDDDGSTMEAVAEWLARSFDMDRQTAIAKMYGIHKHGYAAIGPYAPDEAARRFAHGQTIAADLGLTKLSFSQQPPEKASTATSP